MMAEKLLFFIGKFKFEIAQCYKLTLDLHVGRVKVGVINAICDREVMR